jgi:glycosyltransferase involved in cell wall biosynthesis
MRIVAILAIRNERAYLSNCLSHLVANGIAFAVVDNDSTDGSTELVHDQKFAHHLAGYRHVPFSGTFSWEEILRSQEQLLHAIDADWHLLLAPDEIMHSYVPDESLASAIARLDQQGYDVINFDEFVFLPVDGDYVPDINGMQPLRYYYFYEPRNPFQMRAWRKAAGLSNIAGAGHRFYDAGIRLAPESFALRHYIFRNQAHAFEKYAKRTFAAEELARGWHRDRSGQAAAHFAFPPLSALHCLASPQDRHLERAHPRKTHFWERTAVGSPAF